MTNTNKNGDCTNMEAKTCSPNIATINPPNIHRHPGLQVVEVISLLMVTRVVAMTSMRSCCTGAAATFFSSCLHFFRSSRGRRR